MQSNNPVFRRSEEFNGHVRERLRQPDVRRQRGVPTRPTASQRSCPARHGTPTTTGRPMTIDSVVQKTAISLFLVIVAAGGHLVHDARRSSTTTNDDIGAAHRGADDRLAGRLRPVAGQLVQARHQPRPWCWRSPSPRASRSAR